MRQTQTQLLLTPFELKAVKTLRTANNILAAGCYHQLLV
jgi:hypothetical protein